MIAHIQTARSLNRMDRHVVRTNLRLASERSRFSATCSIEEALRLAVLPGEEEGRIYLFNKVSLPGLPAYADRNLWMERVQSTLAAVAATAILGSHPSATNANAIYFHNVEDALESLISITLHALSHVDTSAARTPWFVAAYLGLSAAERLLTHPAALLEALLERVSPPAMPLPAAAALLLPNLLPTGPLVLARAIPESTFRKWLSVIAPPIDPSHPAPEATPVTLSNDMRALLQAVANEDGWRSPATLWLACLAVAATTPSKPTAEIYRASLAVLRKLEHPFQVHSSSETALAASLTSVTKSRSIRTTHESPANAADACAPPALASDSTPAANNTTAEARRPKLQIQSLLGEPTPSAGLYFLLHVLRHLGIVATLKDNPDLAEAELPAHILQALALHSRVALDDPILSPLGISGIPFSPPGGWLTRLTPKAYPSLLSNSSGSANLLAVDAISSPGDLLKLWTRAVRLWCVQNARSTIRRIVRRPGHIWLTRTDLDITLPLTAADLRIRRAGLDIDPLWLPWLGQAGRVVRFHYRNHSASGAN